MKNQAEKDANFRMKCEDMGFTKINIWVPDHLVDKFKKEAKKYRDAERARFKRIALNKAMKKGKRPAGRPSHCETTQSIKDDD